MRKRTLSSIALWLAGAAGAQASVNLVVNGNFQSNLTVWVSGDGSALWSAESAIADGSGSARITCDNPSSGACQPLLQCVLVNPGLHLLELAVRVPAGQPTTGEGYAIAYVYPNTTCSGMPVAGGFSTASVTSATWRSRWVVVNVPAGGASVSVRLTVVKNETGGEFDVLADAVRLSTGLRFADGFQSGTTAQWSLAVP